MTLDSEFLIDDKSSKYIILPDGRQLGYAEYGVSDGLVIICLHGLPGSRIDFVRFDDAAKVVGARIVSIDRPGIGLSSPYPQATLSSVAEDVGHLADFLKLEEYAILGGSAGGPYALACAYALPKDKLKAVALVASPGKSAWSTWLICELIKRMPIGLIAWHWKRDPGAQTQLSLEQQFELLRSLANKGTPHDREAGLFNTTQSLRIWLSTSREAFKDGVDAVVRDTYRLATDWGFYVNSVEIPVRLWYGRFDAIAPVSQGKDYAAKLGDNACLRVVDETHGSMFANQSQSFLADLVGCLTGQAMSHTNGA